MSKRHAYWNIVDKNRFTINANGDCVAFALGNLQYRASDGKWRFAEHQYDVLRDGGGQTTPLPQRETQADWIDLFNYGSTGYNNGQVAYQPWNADTNQNHFYNGDTVGTTADFSYPYNQQEGTNYRTLTGGLTGMTEGEWYYIIGNRQGERFALATVNGIEGLILIPDGTTIGLNNINTVRASMSGNIITANEWEVTFEPNGFIFLPCGGEREGVNVVNAASPMVGYYHASTQRHVSGQEWRSYYLQFGTDRDVALGHWRKSEGLNVRLVIDL